MPQSPDDSTLKAYAEARGLSWAWRVVPEGEAWRAYVELGNLMTNGLDADPQAALDSSTALVIRCREARARTGQGSINVREGR